MTTPAWWTSADARELDVLVWELVDGYFDHREDCDDRPCPHLGQALEIVLDWRRGRELRSRAAWIRAVQDELEARSAA